MVFITSPIVNYFVSVKQGDVPGIQYLPIAGHNDNVGTSFTTVAPFDSNQIVDTIAAVATVALASTSTDDDSAGTGLRTLTLIGLDGSGNPQSETLTLNGQTKVVSANTYTAVNGMVGLTAGSGGVNAGTVSVGLGSDTFSSGVPDNDVYHAMEPTWNLSRTAAFRVPTGKDWIPSRVLFVSDSGKTATVRVLAKQPGGIYITFIEFSGDNATVDLGVSSGNVLPAGTDIRVDGKVSAGSGSIFLAISYILADA